MYSFSLKPSADVFCAASVGITRALGSGFLEKREEKEKKEDQ
jgi:hypothetical protein